MTAMHTIFREVSRFCEFLLGLCRLCFWVVLLSTAGFTPVAFAEDNTPAEVRVGDLGFKVVSIRLSEDREDYRFNSWAIITIKVVNHGKAPISLNYVAGKTTFVNERGYTWEEEVDHHATGLTIASNNSADTHTVIDPGSESGMSIPLHYSGDNPGQTTGNTFTLKSEFLAVQDMGEGRLKPVGTYPVKFSGLHKTATPEATKKVQGEPPVKPEPIQVGDLSFKLDSLEVTHPKGDLAHNSWATISMTISNQGKKPIALDYFWGQANFVNDRGTFWSDVGEFIARQLGHHVSGVPLDKDNRASVGTVIDPGKDIHVTIPLIYNPHYHENWDNISIGSVYDFTIEFSAIKDMGEGVVRRTRVYPVTFVGLSSSGGGEGSAFKRGLGKLFGN